MSPDEMYLIPETKLGLEYNGKFPVRTYIGNNYGELYEKTVP
jgi:hypothetical protein